MIFLVVFDVVVLVVVGDMLYRGSSSSSYCISSINWSALHTLLGLPFDSSDSLCVLSHNPVCARMLFHDVLIIIFSFSGIEAHLSWSFAAWLLLALWLLSVHSTISCFLCV